MRKTFEFSVSLESPHQVDMKNVVESSKNFFGYFNTLETHSYFHNKNPYFYAEVREVFACRSYILFGV
jgi:hypothetical protein